jgi:hypothetical protein
MFEGLVEESIMMAICEFYELDVCLCLCGGEEHWCLALVWGSYYVLVFLGIDMGWVHMCILIAIPGLLIR